jgi:hypothetical protein
MRQGIFSRRKPDAITVVLSALLAVAAVWMLADQLTGARNILEDRLFSFALGLALGNAVRLVASDRRV